MEMQQFKHPLELNKARALSSVLNYFLEVRQAGDEIESFNFLNDTLHVLLNNSISLRYEINSPKSGVQIWAKNQHGNISQFFNYDNAVTELHWYLNDTNL